MTLTPRTVAQLDAVQSVTGASRSEIVRRGVELYVRSLASGEGAFDRLKRVELLTLLGEEVIKTKGKRPKKK